MKTRLRNWLLGSLIALTIVVIAVVLEFVVLRGQTPPITQSDGRPIPGSVATLEAVSLGGTEQWILVRGEDRGLPVLLFLHGGPGMPAMYLAHAFQRDLERHFLVVHWDRPGAGKSYRAAGSAPITVRQTLEETYELTRFLRARFEQDRIFLVGHSWGSYLGLLAAAERPDFFHAFVGVGQVAADRDRVRAVQREFVVERALEEGDTDVAEKLAAGAREVTEDDLFRYGGQLHAAQSFWPLLKTGLRAPEYTLMDAWNVRRGANLLLRRMQYDVIEGPLDAVILDLDIPVFFILGRHDYTTPSSLAEQYFDELSAPLKEVIWFENSAHFPFFEEPARFSLEMARIADVAHRFWEFTQDEVDIDQ